MSDPHLIRVLSLKPVLMRGEDVEAVRRGSIRYLGDDQAWKGYQRMPTAVRQTFGPGMRQLVKRVEQKARMHEDGAAGPAVDRVLRKSLAYDSECDRLLAAYQAKQQPTECYPHALGSDSHVGQGLHPTAGLYGNWAIDFMAPGGTVVVAVVEAEVVKISGHPPTYVPNESTGIFGWNLHYVSEGGYRWFSTHYGSLTVRTGQRLRVGTKVGEVGRWPHDPGRSHTHLGVTSPKGYRDAQRTIERIAYAPRVAAA